MMKSEMSNVAQTCNRLSKLLRERGVDLAFQNINMSSSPKLPISGTYKEVCGPASTTMNLFPKNMVKEENVSTGENLKSLNLFPLNSSSAAVTTEQESTNNMPHLSELASSEEQPKTTTTNAKASMTIFYGGNVLVFDDLPEDKAQEVISLATQGMTPNNTTRTSRLNQSGVFQGPPIARRVSLHRFIEKRKDRVAANTPYQLPLAQSSQHEKYNMMRNLGQRQEQERELVLFK